MGILKSGTFINLSQVVQSAAVNDFSTKVVFRAVSLQDLKENESKIYLLAVCI